MNDEDTPDADGRAKAAADEIHLQGSGSTTVDLTGVLESAESVRQIQAVFKSIEAMVDPVRRIQLAHDGPCLQRGRLRARLLCLGGGGSRTGSPAGR
ncbi:hypothetical protein ACFYPC_34100 [Streptomyces sp. NPDC005808]|uniref:hypothetical protein n=1 Tax=Streptomyces sp. NPDC005808 TaxID=3364734 RepID=UPI00367B1514